MKSHIIFLSITVACVSHTVSASEKDTYRGFLVVAPEVETFQPCGSTSPLWLDIDLSSRAPVERRYRELITRPYEKTFAVLVGSPGPKLDCGFCENYEGSFKVQKILEHRRATQTECTQ